MNILTLPIDKLKPYENNPRHNEDAVDKVAESIREFGFLVPIVIDKDYVIAAGHTRLLAAQELGLTEVPCVMASDLTDEQIKAFRLADNKTSEFASWDFAKLEIEMMQLETFDMERFGFETEGETESATAQEDDYVSAVEDEPRAKVGDIYQLGEHRLICGDSTDPEIIERLLDGEEAELLLTDPPYGVSIVKGAKVGGDKPFGSARGKARNAILEARKYAPIIGDNTTETAKKCFEIAKEHTKTQIIFGGNYFTEFLPPSRCWIVWDKVVPKESFFAQVELAWCSKDGNAKIYKQLWSGLCREGERETEGKQRMHPTQKPVGMLGEIIKDFTNEFDNILDCFGGSGSTLIACEQLNRRCFMAELDPHYIDIIIDRWEQYTGEKAILLKSGD